MHGEPPAGGPAADGGPGDRMVTTQPHGSGAMGGDTPMGSAAPAASGPGPASRAAPAPGQASPSATVALANYRWAAALWDALAEAGVRHVCLCPGSRSTPLAVGAQRHPRLRVWVHLDERSAAFFALGLAKVEERPAVVLATSGTAGANFFPAVVEARYGRVPLIVLTADRPHSLREFGSPQTIDQVHLYGRHAKWFVDLPLPADDAGARRYVGRVAARAVLESITAPAGPVHINVPLPEPLVPPGLSDDPSADEACGRDRLGPASAAAAHVGAGLGLRAGGMEPDPGQVAALAARALRAPRGLIVCGPLAHPSPLADSVPRLAALLGYPVLADPLSGLRCGHHDRWAVVDAYDAFLREPRLAQALAPQLVLRFGGTPTSKPLMQYLERHGAAEQVLVDPAGWNDPLHTVHGLVRADPHRFCQRLVEAIAHLQGEAEGRDPDPFRARAVLAGGGRSGQDGSRGPAAGDGVHPPDQGGVVRPMPIHGRRWLQLWWRLNQEARAAIGQELSAWGDEPAEARVFAELASLLPDGSVLVVGNSMPVRDLDGFFPSGSRRIRFLANRGANGIDGVVSTALGAAAAAAGPTVLVIGDLSFYHDMNGLVAAGRHGLALTIVLIHNDGGGIFSFLPQVQMADVFEPLFGTPHGLDFRHAAALYGLLYHRPGSWEAFREAVRRSLESSRQSTLIEVRTDRQRNVLQHHRVWRAVARRLEGAGLMAEAEALARG